MVTIKEKNINLKTTLIILFISTDKPSSESIINEQVELDQDKFNQIVDTFIGTSKSIDDINIKSEIKLQIGRNIFKIFKR